MRFEHINNAVIMTFLEPMLEYPLQCQVNALKWLTLLNKLMEICRFLKRKLLSSQIYIMEKKWIWVLISNIFDSILGLFIQKSLVFYLNRNWMGLHILKLAWSAHMHTYTLVCSHTQIHIPSTTAISQNLHDKDNFCSSCNSKEQYL